MKRDRLVGAILFIITMNILSQAATWNDRLDSLMNALEQNNKFMGSLAISKAGKPIYVRACGYADVEHKVAAQTETKYRIGSVSKVFTAVMIFQLIEEKKLSLDTRLAQFFPEIPNADRITISNLLNHRSGIHNFTDSVYMTYYTKPKTQKELLDIFKSYPPEFNPGEKMQYSNTNYVLLGYIIERVTKKDYDSNLQKRICKKLGLKNTYYGSKIRIANREAYSYTYDGKYWVIEPETDMSIPHGAGGIVSTATDLVVFINGLFNNKLVQQSSLDEMLKLEDRFGKGLFQMPFYTHPGFGHIGGIDAFSASLIYFPEDSLAIAVCSNGLSYPMNDILAGALKIYFNMPYQMPVFETVELSIEQLQKFTGVYSRSDFPFKFTIALNGHQLNAQATGQRAFPLEPVSSNEFKFDPVGIKMIFGADGQLTIQQRGMTIILQKE